MSEPGPKNKKTTEKKVEKSDASKKKKPVKNTTRPRKIKPNQEDGIAKSKQLLQKLQTSTSRSSIGGRSKPRSSKNSEFRTYGNGKPMPSLAELEKMFEDSDTEDEIRATPHNNPCTSTPVPAVPQSPQNSLKLTSPKTIAEIANKMLDVLSNLTEPPVLLNDGSLPPIIKPKKRKKTETPYIVGCKDRPYVPCRPNNSVFKGEEKYGIDENDCDDEDEIPKKRAKRGKKVNLSKSFFNAASDEIAARLKEQYDGNSDASSDSNKTVAYEYYTPNNNRVRSFSPLPSTSKDNETFVKNDQLFNESLLNENASSTCHDNDVEIVETPCETIVVNDTLPNNTFKFIEDPSVIELIDDSSVGAPNNNGNTQSTTVDDDSIQIVDVKSASPIPVEEYYSSCCTKSPRYNDDICEVIDIDDIIAENAAIIKKYSRKSDLDTITHVDTSSSVVFDGGTNVQVMDVSNSTNIPVNNNLPSPPIPPRSNAIPGIGNERGSTIMQSSQHLLLQHPDIWEIGKTITVAPVAVTPIAIVPNDMQPLGITRPSTMQSDIIVCSTSINPANPPRQFVDQGTNQRIQQQPQADTSRSMNSDEGGSKRIGDCPICMDTLSYKPVASTLCGHLFCMNCIQLAIKSNGKKCPTCRKKLKGAGFHQIFL